MVFIIGHNYEIVHLLCVISKAAPPAVVFVSRRYFSGTGDSAMYVHGKHDLWRAQPSE